MERREETVSSAAERAASISGVLPVLVDGCKETVMNHQMTIKGALKNYKGAKLP